jgi:L-fucose isomerase-like protein
VSKRNLRPIKLGLVVGSREFFNAAPTLETRKELIAHLDRLNISYSILPLEATKNGAAQSREDASLYARHFREQRDSIDGLVICLPNFGNEIAISELVNEARLNVPILLQASNDEVDKVDVHSRRDAFCGKFSVTNNFYQYGVRFTDTTSHTSDIGGDEFARDLDRFVRTCRVVRGLSHARIGSIGARTGSFQTMRFSEKLLQASGLTVVTVDLSEIIFSAGALGDDAPEVKAMLEEISAYGRIPAHIKREKIVRQAKWTIAVDRWIEENECDARAIQCWRSLQDNFGCATCVTMSMMGEKLSPSACEVGRDGRDLNVRACAGRRGAVRNP